MLTYNLSYIFNDFIIFFFFFSSKIRKVDEKVVSKSMTVLKCSTSILNHSDVIEKVLI